MSPYLVLALATFPIPGTPAWDLNPAVAEVRALSLPPAQLRNAISAGLRREALAKTREQKHFATEELLRLYRALARRTDMAEDSRKEYRGKLLARLENISKALKREIAREKVAAEKQAKIALAKSKVKSLPPAASSDDAIHSPAKPQVIAGAQGGRYQADYGQTLVDLIKSTISPSSWTDAGGEGTIYYFPNLQVIVVRQTSEVHENLGGLIQNLRRAGK